MLNQGDANVSISLCLKAKLESDRLIVSVGKKAPQEIAIKVKNQSSSPSLSCCWDFKHLLQGISGEGPLRLVDFKEFSGFQIALLNKVGGGKRNRTNIPLSP